MTLIRFARTLCCGLTAAVTLALGGCSGSSPDNSSSSVSAINNSSAGIGLSSSSSSAAILGIETPSAISVVTATNAN